MAFGQQSGPPATHRQLQELTELLQQAGHVDFRDARGPLGLTQRQAGGKFTRDEADELIAQLQRDAELAEAIGPPSGPGEASPPPPTATQPIAKRTRAAPASASASRSPATRAAPPAGGAVAAARARREAEALQRLRDTPDDVLAAELERRGWSVTPP